MKKRPVTIETAESVSRAYKGEKDPVKKYGIECFILGLMANRQCPGNESTPIASPKRAGSVKKGDDGRKVVKECGYAIGSTRRLS